MDMQRGFRIGEWDVLPLDGDIRREGEVIHLEPKVMEVLLVLADKAESVVLREELLDKVWGPRAAISDEPLTRCIAQLRQALGDSSRQPTFIQTVPKRGYRLMQAVQIPQSSGPVTAESATGNNAPAGPPPASGLPVRTGPASVLNWQAMAAILVVMIVGLAFGRSMILDGAGPVDPRCEIDAAERDLSERARGQCDEGLSDLDDRDALKLEEAMAHLRAAIRAEPDYGAAYVLLARAMALYPSYQRDIESGVCADESDAGIVVSCFDAAFDLLESNQHRAPYIARYTHGIRGYVFTRRHEWEKARGAFDEAVRVWPDDADMRQWYSQLLSAVGDRRGALEQAEYAYRLAPDVPVIAFRLVVALMWNDRMEEAALLYDEAKERFIGHNPYRDMEIVMNLRLNRMQEVARLLAESAEAEGLGTNWVDDFVRAHTDPSYAAEARSVVEAAVDSGELSGQAAYGAMVYLGEPGRAIALARELVATRPQELDVEFLFVAETAKLREHPDFDLLVQQLGLDAYWEFYCPDHFSDAERMRWCRQP